VVPVDLLAYLHAFGAGRVEYDAARRLFVPTPREPTFERARLYATTIDDVPDVVRKLKERQFAVMSQSTRISEIHQQDFSLGLLVLIVGAGVFLFGVVTVVTVLLDSTERKRGTIGILRVMGVPRTAVFYMVFLRAAVIGSIAAGLTIGLGYLTGHVLGWEPSPNTTWVQWKPVIKVIIKPDDILLVVAGALTCCGLGSLIPAFRASRLDPFDAIVEGRFR
jgi:putative ABC transport system permease protein